MKILIITSLAPLKNNPNSGIFVTKRLEQYKKFDVEYTAISLGFQNSSITKFVAKILKKALRLPIEEFGKVKYTPVLINRNFLDFIITKTNKNSYFRYIKNYVKKITMLFQVQSFDIIHAHGMYFVPAGEVAYYIAKKYNKPYVVTLHGSDVNLIMPKRKKKYIGILENATKVIFVSRALLEKAKSLGYSGKNSVVIPNGIDPEIFKPMEKEKIRKELGIYKKGIKYIGFVADLLPIKRADKLPEIFVNIMKEMNNVKFLIVGDGVLKEKIAQEMKGIDVIFTGMIPQEEVAKYMNAMDVIILPSRNEGWPCVVLEAQACGTCVIGSSNGGIPEAIGFEEYVVEEGKEFEKRFAKKVVEVLEKGYDRSAFINRAKNFTWEEIIKSEIEVYKDILESKE
jgi:glycosyltransferase involved in cell wall biosynthesis